MGQKQIYILKMEFFKNQHIDYPISSDKCLQGQKKNNNDVINSRICQDFKAGLHKLRLIGLNTQKTNN